jgi:hypothetical protein
MFGDALRFCGYKQRGRGQARHIVALFEIEGIECAWGAPQAVEFERHELADRFRTMVRRGDGELEREVLWNWPER